MSRREFSKAIKRDAFLRANGHCENLSCKAYLTLGKFAYDHVIPDGLGGEPTLENCEVLCLPCHKDKTSTRDIPAIAKTKRIQDRQRGIKKPSRFFGSRDSGWKKKISGEVVRR